MKTLINEYSPLTVIAKCLNKLHNYKLLINSRNALARLDDDMLKDIGLTRAEAEEEAAKPFWKNELKKTIIKDDSKPSNKLAKLHSN